MRITWLLEVADQLWGGVKVALESANWLSRHGHEVTVISRSGPPTWMQLDCRFQQVADFRPEHLPAGDVLIGTFWTTVPWVASAGADKGTPVHLCQGYEGDSPGNEALRDRIEAVYRLPGLHRVTVSPHLTTLLRERFGIAAHEVPNMIDHAVHRPGPARRPQSPLRVGLVGPYQVACKDLASGYAACRLAHAAGQQLVLVRASNTPPSPKEREQPFPVEWHQQLRPDQMGEFYRSLDVFLGTSSGDEGFFLPAVEAMACGIPSVLTDIPCVRNHQQLVGHDRYALFVPPRDPAAMAEAIVLAGALPDVRDTLRSGGIEVASHYHADRHGQQLDALLQQLVGGLLIQRPTALRLVGTAAGAPAVAGTEVESEVEVTAKVAAKVEDRGQDRVDTTIPMLLRQLAQLGEQLAAGGQHHDAARVLSAACCLAPDDTDLQFAAASAHLAAGNFEQALRRFTQLIDGGRDDEALHAGRGHALHALDRMQEAAQAFRAALAIGPRTADAYNRLGVVLFQAGDVAAARQNFERALAVDPRHQDARANLTALPAA